MQCYACLLLKWVLGASHYHGGIILPSHAPNKTYFYVFAIVSFTQTFCTMAVYFFINCVAQHMRLVLIRA